MLPDLPDLPELSDSSKLPELPESFDEESKHKKEQKKSKHTKERFIIPKTEYDEDGRPKLMIPDLNDIELNKEIDKYFGVSHQDIQMEDDK